MYFIRNGVVDILVGDIHVATLQEGDYFGGQCKKILNYENRIGF